MTALISPELMEKTWQSVASMSSDELRRRQDLCGKEQEELTNFVLALTTDLSPDAGGLALYIHLVVVEAFRRTKMLFRKVDRGTVERIWKESIGFINDLKRAGHGRQSFQLGASLCSEPAALQYVVNALTETDADDPVDFADDDFWQILRILKTLIDCMHDAHLKQ